MSSIADLLEQAIAILDDKYHVTLEPCVLPDDLAKSLGVSGEIKNQVYDSWRHQLEQLKPDSQVLKSVYSGNKDSDSKKIKHNPPMTSISKASHEDRQIQEEQLFKWIKDCSVDVKGAMYDLDAKEVEILDLSTGKHEHKRTFEKRTYPNVRDKLGKIVSYGEIVTYPKNYFYMSYKLDGVAIALYYEKGKLVKAGLRPRDGINGEDVTEQVKYVSGVKQVLDEPVTCSIRGELICKLDDFEKVQMDFANNGEKLRANPRNHAAGGIRHFKEPEKVKDMRLSFIGYGIEGLENPPYKTEIERAKWANQKLGVPFIRISYFNFYDLIAFEEFIKNLNYEVDGVIIGVNDLDIQEQFGRSGDSKTGNPKGKIAWKFEEEKAYPVLEEITWEPGRTGRIVPVANFSAVKLAGTEVRRATLHNWGFVFSNGIVKGTELIVVKAGKIIPKVIGVRSGQGNPTHPFTCKSCNMPVLVRQNVDKYELMCDNQDCSAKNIRGLEHYLKTLGVLGLGESKIESLVVGGVVSKFSDFYKLNISDIVACELSERQALLILGGIHMIQNPEQLEDDDLKKKIEFVKKNKKKVPLAKLFAAFGISSAGRSAGKSLVDHFENFDKIRSSSIEELSSVNDIGEKTAKIIFDYLKNHKNEIDELLNYIEPEVPKIGPLTGKTFVLTGSFVNGKRFYEEKIESLGGKCGSSVGKNTDFVVEGPDAGSKAEKARKLGLKIISELDLEKML